MNENTPGHSAPGAGAAGGVGQGLLDLGAPAGAPGAAASPAGGDSAPERADTKAPDAFRTIGEVAKALAIKPHVLRYWEEQFPMLRPVKRAGGRRYYRPEDMQLLETINRLVHGEGFTLRGARAYLEAQGGQRAAATTEGALITGLYALRADLRRLLADVSELG